jgi:hypothetical protein
MLVYYGKKGTKSCIPMASIPGENPVGVLGLVCAAVRITFFSSRLAMTHFDFPQVERALAAHSMGFYIKSRGSFSEASCGPRTAIYVKLAKDMSASQWAAFYGMLHVHEDIEYRLKEFSNKPADEEWADDPEQYFIAESDPADHRPRRLRFIKQCVQDKPAGLIEGFFKM